MRALAVLMAVAAASALCLTAIFLHAIYIPTRPEAEFAKSWARQTLVMQTTALDGSPYISLDPDVQAF